MAASEGDVVGLLEAVLQVRGALITSKQGGQVLPRSRLCCGLELDVPACPASHCLPTPIPSPLFSLSPACLPAAAALHLCRGARVHTHCPSQVGAQVRGAGAANQGAHRLLRTGEQRGQYGRQAGLRLGCCECMQSQQSQGDSATINAPSLVLAAEFCFPPPTLASWRRARSWRCRRAAWSTRACLRTQPSAHRRVGRSAERARD